MKLKYNIDKKNVCVSFCLTETEKVKFKGFCDSKRCTTSEILRAFVLSKIAKLKNDVQNETK